MLARKISAQRWRVGGQIGAQRDRAHRFELPVVVPSLLSLIATPSAASSSRRRSDSAQFRAARAASALGDERLDRASTVSARRRIRVGDVSAGRWRRLEVEAERRASRSTSRLARPRVAPARCSCGDRGRRVEIVGERLDQRARSAPAPAARRRPIASYQRSSVALRFLERPHRPVDRLAVMGAQHREPQHLARPLAAAERRRVAAARGW